MVDKVHASMYVINMKESKDRWESVKSQRHLLPMTPTRVEAVNGREIKNLPNNVWLTPGVIGCFLSHRKVLKRVAANKDNYAIICEDDVIFTDDFSKHLKKVIKDLDTQPNWDLVYLGCYGAWRPDKKFKMIATASNFFMSLNFKKSERVIQTKHLITPNTPLGSHCYMVNYHSAQKLLKLLTKYEGYDQALIRHLPNLNAFVSKKRIAFQNATSDNSTLATNFPKSLNSVVSRWKEDKITYDFYFSAPLGQIKGFIINFWSIVYILSLVLLPYRYNSLMLLFLSIESLYSGVTRQLLQWSVLFALATRLKKVN